jgi:sodium/bile acid cotransporter 7
VLPLMIFHQLQLFLCAFLAARWGREAAALQAEAESGAHGLPQTAHEAGAAAQALGFAIPEACVPGVVDNLALLGRHAAALARAR